MKYSSLFHHKKTIMGMIHLPPMPGYAGHPGMNKLIQFALDELLTLEKGGIHGVLLENENDKPHAITSPKEVISAMTAIAQEVVKASAVPVGVEVLLNDPESSLAIARAAGAQFIRTDYFVDLMSRTEYGGQMHIDPVSLMNYKHKIKADNIVVLTDIQVKYANLIEKNKPISLSAIQAKKAGSDAIVVSGSITGEMPQVTDIQQAYQEVFPFPILVGSGFGLDNCEQLLKYANGAIVGTSLKKNNRVNLQLVQHLMAKVEAL